MQRRSGPSTTLPVPRRDSKDSKALRPMGSSSSVVSSVSSKASDKFERVRGREAGRAMQPARRRLSAFTKDTGFEADGAVAEAVAADPEDKTSSVSGSVFTKIAARTKTGVVPMNPHKVNQDSHWEIESFGSDPTQLYLGVADGHGSFGHDVSGLIKRRLPAFLLKEPALRSDPKEALRRACQKTNQELYRSPIDIAFSGSTCVSVFVRGNNMLCANIGDSRAMIGKAAAGASNFKVVNISDDHNPDRPDEQQRILAAGGRVNAFKGPHGEALGPQRVWLKHQDAPGLAMARAMGDSVAASVGVIAEPEIMTHTLTNDDRFLVIASDGVWEFISSEECAQIVGACWLRNPSDAGGAAEELAREAVRRWRQEEEVVDDTTCIVAFLNVP